MFRVKRKDNPAIIYTVLSVVYEQGKLMFLIYNTTGQFELVCASQFELFDPDKHAIGEMKNAD